MVKPVGHKLQHPGVVACRDTDEALLERFFAATRHKAILPYILGICQA
jgi:hypothetical protein